MTARVLVLEDNLANLELMKYLLNAFGYTSILAHNGREGMDVAIREIPDLILCDVQMPDVDGYEFVRQAKSHPMLANIPIIAVTAFAMVGDREKMLKAGFDGYVSKPIQPELFIQQMEPFLPPALRASVSLSVETSAQEKPSLHSRNKSILIVDNIKVHLDLAESIFKYAGYRVFTTQDAQAAITLARQHHPDIIVSDVCMPQGDGYDLITTVKADPDLSGTPFVFLTSTAMTEGERRKGLALGAVKYLFRPIEPEQLLAEIEACFNQ